MPQVQLRVNIGADEENWLAAVSTDFPDAEFTILASQPTEGGVLEIMEVTAVHVDAIVRRFEEALEVRSHDVLHAGEGLALVQVVFPMPATYEARRATEILPRFPLTVQDGWIASELLGSPSQLSGLTTELAAADIPYEVVSIRQTYDAADILTERQRELVTEAVERGYYDSPRGCTLVELAAALDVSQSAASGVLHRAESRIIKAFIA